jgi:hypothetical protein
MNSPHQPLTTRYQDDRLTGVTDVLHTAGADPHPRVQMEAVDAVEAVAPGRGFLLYTYCITSPLPYGKLGLGARRLAWTPLNFPPASVWRYRPGGG